MNSWKSRKSPKFSGDIGFNTTIIEIQEQLLPRWLRENHLYLQEKFLMGQRDEKRWPGQSEESFFSIALALPCLRGEQSWFRFQAVHIKHSSCPYSLYDIGIIWSILYGPNYMDQIIWTIYRSYQSNNFSCKSSLQSIDFKYLSFNDIIYTGDLSNDSKYYFEIFFNELFKVLFI